MSKPAPRMKAAAPVPAAHREALRAWMEADGEAGLGAALGLSRMAIYRVLAELPVYPGTRALLREALTRRVARATEGE